MNKKLITLAISVGLLYGGAVAALHPMTQPITNDSLVVSDTTTKQKTPFPAPLTDSVTPADVAVTVESQPTTATETQIAVPTNDEVVATYPNLSSNPQLLQCSHDIINAFPHRFTDSNREVNLKILSEKFVSSCSAIGPGNRGTFPFLADTGSGDFFVRNGGL